MIFGTVGQMWDVFIGLIKLLKRMEDRFISALNDASIGQ
jgi:hypothetical protein